MRIEDRREYTKHHGPFDAHARGIMSIITVLSMTETGAATSWSAPGDRRIMVVCHGPGRGRQERGAQRILARATDGVPWRHQLQIHTTGSPVPALDGVAAVVFWLADPLRELYPDCFAEASHLTAEAQRRGIRVVNRPEALSNTIKSKQSEIWQAAGIPCAPVATFASPAELSARLATATYPVIVRPDLLHGQQSAFFCTTAGEAEARAAAAGMTSGALISFLDTRAGYARTHPGTIWERYYHKKRTFVFGSEVVQNHVYFSEHPICGLKRSTFFRYMDGRWRWAWTAYLRPTERTALAIDYAFWRGPLEHAEVMRKAVRVLGLDFAAIDYSVTADGKPVLWEANPYFDLPDADQSAMPRERRLPMRIASYDRAIGRFLGRLLTGEEESAVRHGG